MSPRLTRGLHEAFAQRGVRFRGRSQRVHGATWCILGVFGARHFELRLARSAFLRRGGLDLREELQGRVLVLLVQGQVRCGANRRNHLENTHFLSADATAGVKPARRFLPSRSSGATFWFSSSWRRSDRILRSTQSASCWVFVHVYGLIKH